MSFDPTQQQTPGQGPYIEYGAARDDKGSGIPQSPYDTTQGAYPYGAAQGKYPPYNVAQGQYEPYSDVPKKAPLPLGQAIAQLPGQYWKVLTRPGGRSFAEEAGKGGWGIILVQLIGCTIIQAALGILYLNLNPLVLPPSKTPTIINGIDVTRVLTTEISVLTFAIGPGLLILVPVAFFLYQGIAFGLAKAFNGQGTFVMQSYTGLLVYVPLVGILGSLLGFIPYGRLIGLGLDAYAIGLSVFALMGAHRLSGGKASAAALLPYLGVALLACCVFFFIIVSASGLPTPS